jgi:hypothetical protein
MSASRTSDPVELVRDRLYVVGGNVPLDGRASWAPAGASGWQPANCYLLLTAEGEPLIVDPGLPVVEREVLAGLRAVMPPGARPRIYITRAQFDCVGNLGAVAGAFPVTDIFTGGNVNPFDSFDTVTSADEGERAASLVLFRSPDESPLEVINATLRILATFWAYDPGTRTLFTSDSFTHALAAAGDGPPVLDSAASDDVTLDDVRSHLNATFWWLRHAETRPIAESLEALFDRYDVESIAPVRGCVLRGRDVVDRHVELVTTVLSEAA